MTTFVSPEGLATATNQVARNPLRAPLTIALVNNMPDAALVATERQFRRLILQKPAGDLRLRLFHLPDMPRGEVGQAYCRTRSEPIEALFATGCDGLVVTGCEPRAGSLEGEPFWRSFQALVDWAERSTVSTLWSCLAAHAAVQHLDGIVRQRLPQKLHGVFACQTLAVHPLLAGLPATVPVPHSRLNDLPERALERAGYRLLTRSDVVGADAFCKPLSSLFVFTQGHPEYDGDSLNREFKRDIARYLTGERSDFPALPEGLFDPRAQQDLEAFAEMAARRRSLETLSEAPAAIGAIPPEAKRWQRAAARFYRNWLALVGERRAAAEAGLPTLPAQDDRASTTAAQKSR